MMSFWFLVAVLKIHIATRGKSCNPSNAIFLNPQSIHHNQIHMLSQIRFKNSPRLHKQFELKNIYKMKMDCIEII